MCDAGRGGRETAGSWAGFHPFTSPCSHQLIAGTLKDHPLGDNCGATLKARRFPGLHVHACMLWQVL